MATNLLFDSGYKECSLSFFNWSIADLQYRVNFCCKTKWVFYIYIHTHTLLHVFFFHYDLSGDTEYSSLCCTVGPCCLSSLYIIACICQSSTPNPFLPHTCSPLATTTLFSRSVTLFRRLVHGQHRFHINVVSCGTCLSLSDFTQYDDL